MRIRAETPPKWDWLFLVVLALGILVRVVYLYQYRASPSWELLTVDNWYHHHWAQSLAAGNIFGDTTYFRAPLYVYSLGLLYAVFGDSLLVGRLFGLLVGIASIGMTYLLARRFVSVRLAATAAAVQAFLPIVIYFESELLLDPLFMLLMQVAVYRALVWLDSRQIRDLFVSGIAFGLAAICRPTALAPALVVLIWSLTDRRFDGSRIVRGAVFVAGTLVCITPIFIRNLVIADDPILIASQDGINLYLGNNEQADGLSAVMPEPLGHNWQIRQVTQIAENDAARKLKPSEVSAYWRFKAVDWIIQNPGDFATLLGKKLIYQFANREVSNNRSLQGHFASFGLLDRNPLSFALVFPCAVLGAIALWRRYPGARMIAFMVAAHAATVALFFFSSRFRLPVLPYLCLLAVAGLAWVWRQHGRHVILVLTVVAATVGVGWLSFHPPIDYPDTWSVQSLMSRGLLLYSNGEFREAMEPFRQAAFVRPDFPEVNLNLGATYLRMGQMDSAEASFLREIRLHPQRYKGYQNLASVKLLRGNVTAARSLADSALSLAPYDVNSNLVWLRALGRDSLRLDVDSLRLLIERAAKATDDDIEVLSEGAAILSSRSNFAAAISFLTRAKESRPPAIEIDDQAFGPDFRHGAADFERLRAKVFYQLGYCHARQGRIGEAIEYSEKAILADSTLVEAYINLQSGYLTQGRLLEADSVLAEAEKRFPNHELIRRLLTPSPSHQ